jgi:2,3-bisphosphoglycerate-independent phosphoglycerate mutase
MDTLSRWGRVGLVRTIPRGVAPGSDAANLSLLGYDPRKCLTGRAPLEAASIGVDLADEDVAFRCNLVTLGDGVMIDYSAGSISNSEASRIVESLQALAPADEFRFYPGVSYRNLMVTRSPRMNRVKCTPPHDILGELVAGHMPRGGAAGRRLCELIAGSMELLARHEVNAVRVDLGENPANAIWLWGQGRRPRIDSFKKRYGVTGAMISAVDLLRGIGIYLGFEIISVPGATGGLDTDYAAKGRAAVEALDRHQLVFVHVEAPDEAGHGGKAQEKLRAIEEVDSKVVRPVLERVQGKPGYRVLVAADHPTPVRMRTHTGDPTPFVIFGEGVEHNGAESFSEAAAAGTGLLVRRGWDLMREFLGEEA